MPGWPGASDPGGSPEPAMRQSRERFLTTHTGSLPRPDDLIRTMFAREEGVPVDGAALAARIRGPRWPRSCSKQADAGVDVVNDGEMSKPSYATYVKDRLTGFGGTSQPLQYRDLVDFPEMAKRVFGDPGRSRRRTPGLQRADQRCATRGRPRPTPTISRRRSASAQATGGVPDARPRRGSSRSSSGTTTTRATRRTSSPSPTPCGTSTRRSPRPGFLLQVDCPDLAMGRHIQFADLSLEEFRRMARLHVEALNHALANIPPEQVRMHLCWGNYEGPHHHDVPLADIVDIVFAARPSGVSFEAANPRHAHEWRVFERVKLPEGKILIPGVIESTTNFIEHPELVAQRIGRYAKLVGRENVIAGTDCGFGTWVGQAAVDPGVVWAKLASLAEGARLASREFWP